MLIMLAMAHGAHDNVFKVAWREDAGILSASPNGFFGMATHPSSLCVYLMQAPLTGVRA